VACAAALTACALVPRPHVFPRAEIRGFVTADGTGFRLDGSPYRFVGVNIYDAAATARYACDRRMPFSDAELTAVLDKLHDAYGATVLRFWTYQTYTDGGGDFSGVDRVVRIAKAAGMRVLPVLEDGPGDCTTSTQVVPKEQYQGDTWFTDGYRVPYGTAELSFRDYVRVVAEHYRDEPASFGWSLVNEAQTTARGAQGRSALVDFAADTATVVRAGDPNHLVTLGTQANGAPGASGPDFAAVYKIPQLDFAEVHDWNADDEAVPGGTYGNPPSADSPSACAPTRSSGAPSRSSRRSTNPCWSARRASAPRPRPPGGPAPRSSPPKCARRSRRERAVTRSGTSPRKRATSTRSSSAREIRCFDELADVVQPTAA
jgi:Cellulase (glycosyl hydrolase family 5)